MVRLCGGRGAFAGRSSRASGGLGRSVAKRGIAQRSTQGKQVVSVDRRIVSPRAWTVVYR